MEVWMLLFTCCMHLQMMCGFAIFQHQKLATKKEPLKAKEETALTSDSVLMSGSERAEQESHNLALIFLQSGDSMRLSQGNCSGKFQLRGLGGSTIPASLFAFTHSAIDTLTHATNFLNLIFQTNDIRESSIKEDIDWYHALVRSLIEGDPQICKAVLAFDTHPVSSKPQLMLQATREENEILLRDISAISEHLQNLTFETEWFNSFKFQGSLHLHKRILNNDLTTLDTPKWNRGDSYIMDKKQIKWSPPFLECENSKFVPRWMVTLSSPFYGLKPDLSPEFKGVVRIDVSLQSFPIDQCSGGEEWFANTHQCDLNSTQCVPQKSHGFRLGGYDCICKPGFYTSSVVSTNGIRESEEDNARDSGFNRAEEAGKVYQCNRCAEGCTVCVDNTPCLVREDWYLRAAVLSFQAFCMLLVFISMILCYHFRKSKRIRSSGLVLLETILFGSLLLYFPVFILYFKPSVFRCILLRWVRTLGFAIVYGTIILKLYRVLKVFLSRTAQRVPYMTSGRVLRMLAVILLIVAWFLAAWTAGVLENVDRNIPLVIQSQVPGGLKFYICELDRWDYMMAIAELLFLFWGTFLCYAVRTVPSTFHEPRYMGFALHNEMILSVAFHIVRFVMAPALHPDWMLLLFFAHTHVTVTVTLGLLFVPKFLHVGVPLREEIAAEVYEDELDMRRSGSYLNSSITSAWSEHSLDPDDIREELKKLYAQLEVHKTKKMTANNPHLQKKRSSRKGLGRSIMRRITEIPESMSRQCSRDERDGSIGGGSHSGSYKKKLIDNTSSSMKVKDDSLKHKVFSLRKSHSTYDHVRDEGECTPQKFEATSKDTSLLDSLMRKKLAKKASEKSDSDSLDAAPLVCKSASAHNLTSDKKPLHPRPFNLQKSLSVIASAKEKALLLTSKAYSLEDNCKLTKDDSNKVSTGPPPSEVQSLVNLQSSEDSDKGSTTPLQQQTLGEILQGQTSSLLKESFDVAEVCPWEMQDMPPPSDNKIQKHVTYAPLKCNSVDSSHWTGKLHDASKKKMPEHAAKHQSSNQNNVARSDVCPWETQEELPKQSQTGPCTDDTASRAHIECEKEKSEESTKLDKLHHRDSSGIPGKTEKSPESDLPSKSLDNAKGHSLASLKGSSFTESSISAEVCPWDHVSTDNVDTDKKEKHIDKRSQSVSSEGPHLSGSSSLKVKSSRSPFHRSSGKGFGLSMKNLMTPGKSKNSVKEKDRTHSGKTKERNHSQKELGKEEGSKTLKESSSTSESNYLGEKMPFRNTTKQDGKSSENKEKAVTSQNKLAEVCPWDVDEHILSQSNNNSKMVDLSEIKPGKNKVSDANLAEICPWDVEDGTSTNEATNMKSVHPQNGEALKLVARELSKTDSQISEICPWDADIDKVTPQQTDIPVSKKAEICPWETDGDKVIPKQIDMSVSKKAEICPWDADIDKVTQKQTDMPVSKKAEICPWETDVDKVTPKQTVMPVTNMTEICPWDTDIDKVSPKQTSMTVTKKAEICPWEAEIDQVTPKERDKLDSKKAEICPWEAEIDQVTPKETNKPVSKKAEICPSGADEIQARCLGSSKADEVCPWGVEDGNQNKTGATKKEADALQRKMEKSSSKQSSVGSDGEPKSSVGRLNKVNDKLIEVCPWEGEETDTMKSKPVTFTNKKTMEVHPWAAMETKAGTTSSEDSIKAEVCPWEAEDLTVNKTAGAVSLGDNAQEKLEKPCSKQEVCPWECEEPKLSKIAEVCPWEVEQTQAVSRKQEKSSQKVSDVCPWETEEPKLTKEDTSQASKLADVCPWEVHDTAPSNTEKVKHGESMEYRECLNPKQVKNPDVCPWDFE
ncbi:probable G-protein coupled receptor 179 [Protopterus annectens]|uniref:probable G-protein coupled receptor 179 n=1 Tax=Protopterus annectens TaxID=7888 RepID=UPI001CFC168D|nr:probable G-protein coupled receptor 179 [Protopterus annectens]